MKQNKVNSKYTIEISPTFVCNQMVVIPPKYLDEEENIKLFEKSNFHHYLIIKKPRVFFKNITIDSKNILKYSFIIKNKEEDLSFDVEFPRQDGFNPKIEFNETKSFVKIYDEENVYTEGDASLIFQHMCIKGFVPNDFIQNWKILYIGQSQGRKEERTAITRLRKHETLQKILADNQDNFKEEIQIVLLEFEPNTTYISTMGFLNGNKPEIDLQQSIKHWQYIMTKAISKPQKITMIEALMIRWFEPEYNSDYKLNFPQEKGKSYSEAYDFDYNNLCFELRSDTIGCKLYTDKREPSFYHTGHIPLYSDDKRKDIFKYFE